MMLRRLVDHCQLYIGLSYLGLICLLWGAPAIVLHPLLPRRLGRPLGRRAAAVGFTSYLIFLRLIGACRFDLSGLDALRNEREGLILAPNHPGLLDAVMVLSKFPDVACIMKSTLMDNLFLGGGARLAGYIRNEPPLRMIRQAVQELRGGSHLLIFPEGTRTVRPPINPCRSSIGLIAARAKAPVQTLLIEADVPFLSKGWPLFRCPQAWPVTFRISLGKRFAPPADPVQFGVELEHYFTAALTGADTPSKPSSAMPAVEQIRGRAPYV